jgi:hypothetical protein
MTKFLHNLSLLVVIVALPLSFANAQPAPAAENADAAAEGDAPAAPGDAPAAAPGDAPATAPAAAPAAAPSAAAMVTGGSAPAPVVSTAVESSTLVTAVQAGLTVSDAVALGTNNINKLADKTANIGGSVTNLVNQFKTRAIVVKAFSGTGDITAIVNGTVDNLDSHALTSMKAFDLGTMKELVKTPDLSGNLVVAPTFDFAKVSATMQTLGTKSHVVKAYVDLGQTAAAVLLDTGFIALAKDTENLTKMVEAKFIATDMKAMAGASTISDFSTKAKFASSLAPTGATAAERLQLAKDTNTNIKGAVLSTIKLFNHADLKVFTEIGASSAEDKSKLSIASKFANLEVTVKLANAFDVTDASSIASFKTEAATFDVDFIATLGKEKENLDSLRGSGGNALSLADIGNIEIKADFAVKQKEENPNAAIDYTLIPSDTATLIEYKKVLDKGLKPSEFKDLSLADLKMVATKTKEELAEFKAAGKTPAQALAEAQAAAKTKAVADAAALVVTEDAAAVASTDTEIQTAATTVQTEGKSVLAGASGGYTRVSRNAALRNAVDVAEVLLTNRTIDSEANLAPDTTLSSLSANGYNYELVRILVKYGALGSTGSTLASAVLGNEYSTFNAPGNLASAVHASTSYYEQFLGSLGARAINANRSSKRSSNSAFSVKTSNVSLSGGSNITFNASAEIDVSSKLPKGDRRIHIIGAAKDMVIKGSLNIDNTNTSENHALVLGAADDLYFRSEESSANSVDYTNPSVVSVTNSGSNLALGAADTIKLVNVSISTGGNLAIGSLEDLHIGSSTAQSNSLSVGTGGWSSDPDNIYLYAHNLIQINGLNITGRVDDVYMEAATINLRNVTFPNSSEVTLRSRNGTISFSTNPNVTHLGVNFDNVKHGATLLQQSSFNGSPGSYSSNKVLPHGAAAVQVKKF